MTIMLQWPFSEFIAIGFMDFTLPAMHIYKLKFNFTASTPVKFRFLDMRDNLRTGFRNVMCFTKRGNNENCDGCSLTSSCIYFKVFEAQSLRGRYRYHPRPFILEPPSVSEAYYKAGENWSLSIILLGDVIELLPCFILCFDELGKRGLIKGYGKFEIGSVKAVTSDVDNSGETIYQSNSLDFSKELFMNLDPRPQCKHDQSSVTMSFKTPTIISENREKTNSPSFKTIIEALIRRISILNKLYGDKTWEADELFLKGAETINIKQCSVEKWKNMLRNSIKSGSHKLEGFVGEITYIGEFVPFLPLLKLGSVLHMGSSTTFGLGKYKIE